MCLCFAHLGLLLEMWKRGKNTKLARFIIIIHSSFTNFWSLQAKTTPVFTPPTAIPNVQSTNKFIISQQNRFTLFSCCLSNCSIGVDPSVIRLRFSLRTTAGSLPKWLVWLQNKKTDFVDWWWICLCFAHLGLLLEVWKRGNISRNVIDQLTCKQGLEVCQND